MTTENEAFEKWNTEVHRAWLNEVQMHECTLYVKNKNGCYQNPSTHSAWQGWKAAKADSEKTLPPEWAEYVGRLEKALNIIVLSEEPNHVADMLSTKGMAITAKQALATKPKG